MGFLPPSQERSRLLKMVYALFERLSIYRYGRIELNLFMSEKEYLVKNAILFSHLNLHFILEIIDSITMCCVNLIYFECGVGHTDMLQIIWHLILSGPTDIPVKVISESTQSVYFVLRNWCHVQGK